MILDAGHLHKVKVLGSGEPTIALGHGFGCDQNCWRHVTTLLGNQSRIVLYDLMGCNSTNAPFFDALRYRTLDGYATDLIKVLEQAGHTPVHYVGHSVSGMIGVLAAIKRPDLFEQIVLINASPHYLNTESYQGGFEPRDIQDMLDKVMENFREWANYFAPHVMSQEFGRPGVAEFSEGILSMQPHIALSMLLTIFNSDLRDKLHLVTTPTVVVQSTADPVVPVTVAQFICSQIPTCEIRYIDVPGHLPHLTNPQTIADIIEDSVSRCQRGAHPAANCG